MTDLYYDYDGLVTDHATWERLWDDRESRRLAVDRVGDYLISTVWLGVDHSWGYGQRPVLWETMVFWQKESEDGAGFDQYMRRYDSREGALAGHTEVVEMVRKGTVQ